MCVELDSASSCNTHTCSFQDCCVYFIASGGVSVYRENAEGESVSTPDTHRLEAQSTYLLHAVHTGTVYCVW